MEGEYYHGLTELGIGQHDKIKKRLDDERRWEYEDYMAHKETQTEKSTRHQWEWVPIEAPTIREGDYYHGLTELGTGQHDKIKKRLDKENLQEYKDHTDRKHAERSLKQQREWVSGDPTTEIPESQCDIGTETPQSIFKQMKLPNKSRKDEKYTVHFAVQSAPIEAELQGGSNVCTQTSGRWENDECNSSGDGVEALEERRQKQSDYGDALRGQIAEKKRNTAQTLKEDKEYDEKDRELAHEYPNTFSYGTQNQNNTSVE